MSNDPSRAARSSHSSIAVRTSITLATLALLAVCGPPRKTAYGATQMQTAKLRPEEQDVAKKPLSDATQTQTLQPRRPENGERAGAAMPGSEPTQTAICEPVLTLADLERMALQANPTLAQAQAAIRAAEGRRVQAGLWPNPVVGYTGEEFNVRAFNEKSEHFAFTALATLLGGSPELKRARAAVERARATIARAKAERVPDLFLRGGFGYSTELLESRNSRLAGRKTGPEGFLEIGVRLPIFNRNQGNITTATAELEIAEREARRVELTLRARMAAVFRNYSNALRVVTQYERHVLPRAKRGYQLYLAGFKQMAAAYPQMLIAQRTLFQAQDTYIDALVDAWQSAIQIQCFLLTGGLDAPAGARPEGGPELSRPEGGIEAGQSPGIRAGAQGVGVGEPISAGRRNQ
jgi:outer membrane protein TolC